MVFNKIAGKVKSFANDVSSRFKRLDAGDVLLGAFIGTFFFGPLLWTATGRAATKKIAGKVFTAVREKVRSWATR